MKLFIWEGGGVLTDYTSGMICAIADDLEGALKAVKDAHPYAEGNYPGSPTEIIDLSDFSKVNPKAWVCWGGG